MRPYTRQTRSEISKILIYLKLRSTRIKYVRNTKGDEHNWFPTRILRDERILLKRELSFREFIRTQKQRKDSSIPEARVNFIQS